MRYRILDLFCGAGGCSAGYSDAGFEVVGVDTAPQPNYPFEFVQADALTFPLDGFDAVHASPPCYAHSDLRTMASADNIGTGFMLLEVQHRLRAQSLPYVIENVEGARMKEPVTLCGSMFNLHCGDGWLKRHRLFECSFPVVQPRCDHPRDGWVIGVYGGGGGGGHGIHGTAYECRTAMGTPWMTKREMNQAIPPIYTRYVGDFLRRYLDVTTIGGYRPDTANGVRNRV